MLDEPRDAEAALLTAHLRDGAPVNLAVAFDGDRA